MRRALIAGIHANLIALEAVAKDIDAERVDEIGCLGGIVTFGPDVIECVELVRQRCLWSLCGHHDLLEARRDPSDLNSIKKAMTRCRSMLEPAHNDKPEKIARWNWLRNLQPKRVDAGALFVFGSARDPSSDFVDENEFRIFEGRQGLNAMRFFEFDEAICFCANTGRPGVVELGGEFVQPSALENSQMKLNPEVKTIVNVGNVGQPRDRDPRGCYVVWDDLQHTVTFHRVPYDIEAAKQRFAAVPEIPARFRHRLTEGV